MGAPTGSIEVWIETRPRESIVFQSPRRCPVTTTVAARSTECCLMVAHVAASGVHVLAAACAGVSAGGLLVAETQRGSLSPMRIPSPRDSVRIAGEPSENVMLISHELAVSLASLQSQVGAENSGGKTDPSAG